MISTKDISYNLSFKRFKQHIVDVTLTFSADNHSPKIWLPSWLAGSYLMREFSRHITAVQYSINTTSGDDANNIDMLRANKVSKNEWLLAEVKSGDRVSVFYEVYCFDLSVRTAYVDSKRIFGNFSSLALAIIGQEQQPVTVSLQVPAEFSVDKEQLKIACGLVTDQSLIDEGFISYTMQADNYDELIDYPFEIAEQSEFNFATTDTKGASIDHRFFISGHHSVNSERLKLDVQKICQTYNTWLEDTPFSDYTFMTFVSGNDYGGLEHINSTALVSPRNDLPIYNEPEEPRDDYQRYLGLCSHEYFHAWWVKTVRPDVMIDVDLRKEAYTPLLWVFEGFTSYVDDYMLQASGVINQASYLKLLTAQINRYNQTAGRALQSVAESSFDAWIKLYRSDENTGNAGISYYNKGALVALCLDLVMLAESNGKYRIFDVIKAFYKRAKQTSSNRYGMNNDNLTEVVSEFIDINVWQDFYENYVIGLTKLPVNELLEKNGLKVTTENLVNNSQPWGMVVSESTSGLKISKINRESVASESGLSANDVIVAIDGIKASQNQLVKVANIQMHSQQDILCYAFRRDELMSFNVSAKTVCDASACPSLGKVMLSFNDKKATDKWLNAL